MGLSYSGGIAIGGSFVTGTPPPPPSSFKALTWTDKSSNAIEVASFGDVAPFIAEKNPIWTPDILNGKAVVDFSTVGGTGFKEWVDASAGPYRWDGFTPNRRARYI